MWSHEALAFERGSANVYVRTACRVCENIQKVVTLYAQEALEDGPDFFGEEGVLKDLAAFLREKGVSEAAVAAQLFRLKVCDYHRDPTPHGQVRDEVRNLRNPDPLLPARGGPGH